MVSNPIATIIDPTLHMHVFTTVNQLQYHLDDERTKSKSISFVPTLGALHRGHLKLMSHAAQIADVVVVSIFVNPTQFNDTADLEKYPRPIGKDIHLLCKNDVDVLFLPPAEEVYPDELAIDVPIDISDLTKVLEGPNRPGHFEGVVTVVKRLLDIVAPDFLIMGQKDYQQQAIVKAMINQLKIPTELVVHPTERDLDGLALSSRNVRIEKTLRPRANTLYSALMRAMHLMDKKTPSEVTRICSTQIKEQGFELEYFAIVDGIDLMPVTDWKAHQSIVACVAAWLGEVRLIDNIRLK